MPRQALFSPYTAREFLTRANKRAERGDQPGALADYDMAIRLAPRLATAYRQRGDALAAWGNHVSALVDYAEALALNNRSAAAYNSRATSRFWCGDYAGAIADYSEALRHAKFKPLRMIVLTSRAAAYLHQGDPAAALADCNTALRTAGHLMRPDVLALLYGYRARAKAALHSPDQALEDAQRALNAAAKSDLLWVGEAYMARATVRLAAGEAQAALADADKALFAARNSPSAQARFYRERALIYATLGEVENAHADLTDAIRLAPHYGPAYTDRATMARHMGDEAAAHADDQHADTLRTLPPDPNRRAAAGERRLISPRMTSGAALVLFVVILELLVGQTVRRNEQQWAAFMRARQAFEQGDYAGAVLLYTDAIAANPGSAEVYNARGLALWHMRNLDGALADFSAAVNAEPNFKRAYFNRGFVRLERGDSAGAVQDFTAAIDLDPRYTNAYVNRGHAHARAGNLRAAIADFRKALELEPNHPQADIINQMMREWLGQQIG
jgi:tetratricopeptide (TPR) repeat protein